MAPIRDAGAPQDGRKWTPEPQCHTNNHQMQERPQQDNQPPGPQRQQIPSPTSSPAPPGFKFRFRKSSEFKVNEFAVARFVKFLHEKRMSTSLNDVIAHFRVKHPEIHMAEELGNRIEDALKVAVELGLLVRRGRFYLPVGEEDERTPLDRKRVADRLDDHLGPGFKKRRKKRRIEGRESDDDDLPPRPENPILFGMNQSHRNYVSERPFHLATRIRSDREKDSSHSRLGKRSRSRSECMAPNGMTRRDSAEDFREDEASLTNRRIRRRHGRVIDDEEYVDEEDGDDDVDDPSIPCRRNPY